MRKVLTAILIMVVMLATPFESFSCDDDFMACKVVFLESEGELVECIYARNKNSLYLQKLIDAYASAMKEALEECIRKAGASECYALEQETRKGQHLRGPGNRFVYDEARKQMYRQID